MASLAKQPLQRTNRNARSQFSDCRVKRANSNKFRNLLGSDLAICSGDGFVCGVTVLGWVVLYARQIKPLPPSPPSTMLKRRRRDTNSKKTFFAENADSAISIVVRGREVTVFLARVA